MDSAALLGMEILFGQGRDSPCSYRFVGPCLPDVWEIELCSGWTQKFISGNWDELASVATYSLAEEKSKSKHRIASAQ